MRYYIGQQGEVQLRCGSRIAGKQQRSLKLKPEPHVMMKMKQDRIYIIDGIPVDEFYEKNTTDLDFYLNGDYHLMCSEKDSNNPCNEQNRKKSDLNDNEDEKDLPF